MSSSTQPFDLATLQCTDDCTLSLLMEGLTEFVESLKELETTRPGESATSDDWTAWQDRASKLHDWREELRSGDDFPYIKENQPSFRREKKDNPKIRQSDWDCSLKRQILYL
jgi:hypothetical protein